MNKKSLSLIVCMLFYCVALFAQSTSGPVSIYSSPSGALIYIDGNYMGTTPLRITGLSPGRHTLRLTYVGYNDYTSTFVSGPSSKVDINAALQKIKGDLVIKANVSNAKVYVNGVYKGYATVTMQDLNPGVYTIKVTRDTYKSYETSVYVESGKIHTVNATLFPTKIDVRVSNITDASIYLDGIYKGRAPLTIPDVSPGTHTIRASKGRYPDESKYLYVAAGTTEYVVLTMHTADLSVGTSPSGATVYVDNVNQGTSPVLVKDLEPGSHKIEIRKVHYAPVFDTVNLSVDYQYNASYPLVKISGYLTVTKTPSDATVTVGNTPVTGTMELDEGNYTVTARKFGYKDKIQSVRIARNQYHALALNLEKAPFEITSFQAENASVDFSKTGNTLKLKFGVSAPEDGTIFIRDSSGAILSSWNISFKTWLEYVEWDGRIDGHPLANGTYTATLSAGGKEKSASFKVESSAKSLSEKIALAPVLNLRDAEQEELQKLEIADRFMRAQNGRSGIFLSAGPSYNKAEFSPSASLGIFFTLPSPFFFAGVQTGASMQFRDNHADDFEYYELALVNPEMNLIGNSYAANVMASVGAALTLGFLRPYVMASAGYFVSIYPPESVLYEEDPRYGSGGILAQGLCAEAEAGLDIKIKRFSIGVAYRLHMDLGAGFKNSAVVSLGWRFW